MLTVTDLRETSSLSRRRAREVVVDACCLGDAELDAHIDDLWAAKSDPDSMRRLLARFRLEVDAARLLLAASAEPAWWSTVTAERLEDACRAARIWAEGDPICSELERRFASLLRSVFGIEIAAIPRGHRVP